MSTATDRAIAIRARFSMCLSMYCHAASDLVQRPPDRGQELRERARTGHRTGDEAEPDTLRGRAGLLSSVGFP
jgi:hypothetical protein